jgi:hypothetical protein
MKTMKHLRFTISKSRFDSSNINDMIFRNEGRPMVRHLLSVVPLLGGVLSRNWAKTCLRFLKQLNQLHKHNGLPGVVKYLKVATVCTQQVVSGYTIPDLNPLGMRISRSKTGLPRIIPADHRKKIMSGDKMVLRFWLTVFSLYRDLHFIGELKLKTITAPSTASSRAHEVGKSLKSFVTLYYRDQDRTFSGPGSIFQILKSGPQSTRAEGTFNSHPVAVLKSLISLLQEAHAPLLESLLYILNFTNNFAVLDLYNNLTTYFGNKLKPSYYNLRHIFLGRLSIKEEAAGKVRVFAMVDPWTQWALKPLHKKLFGVLHRIPSDGTFDQLKPLVRVPFGRVPIYSFDLSAATDRLPLWLQRDLLSIAYSPDFAHHWANLMVGRDYKTPSRKELGPISVMDKFPKSVRYTVGQPMGALSSWAMLAMTHHYIVHHCAWISSVTPIGNKFSQYAVLGDDIVIWNRRVARTYLRVMRTLGVELGLAKSIVSLKGKGLEFAKKTLVDGEDVSPIPFKELSSAHRSMAATISFGNKYKLTTLQVLRFLGYGYKVTPNKPSRIIRALDTARLIPRTYEDLLRLFSTNYAYMDWQLPTTFPKATVKRHIVTMIGQEVGNTLTQLKQLKNNILMLDCKSQVSAWGPLRTVNSKITADIVASYSDRYLKQVCAAEQALNALLYYNLDIISFYKSIYFDIPFSSRQKLEPYPASFTSLVSKLFDARRLLDEIQLDLLANPKPGVSKSPTFLEEARTIRLWQRWSKTLLKVPLGTAIASKKFNHLRND